jgi:hypothetical protein
MRTLRKPVRSRLDDVRLRGAIFRTPIRDVLARYRAERAAMSSTADNGNEARTANRS